MSGTADTSQPGDRVAFVKMIEGGGAQPNANALATAVVNCPLTVPIGVAYLLDLAAPATYAQAAARVRFRLVNGPFG